MRIFSFGRRLFIKRTGKVTALSVATILAPSVFTKSTLGEETGKKGASDSADVKKKVVVLDLTAESNAALLNVGGAVKYKVKGKKAPLMVIRTSDDGVVALSSSCTHKGCVLNLPENGTMVCPCHQARFDVEGKVVKGPAKDPLQAFPATLDIEKKSITITL